MQRSSSRWIPVCCRPTKRLKTRSNVLWRQCVKPSWRSSCFWGLRVSDHWTWILRKSRRWSSLMPSSGEGPRCRQSGNEIRISFVRLRRHGLRSPPGKSLFLRARLHRLWRPLLRTVWWVSRRSVVVMWNPHGPGLRAFTRPASPTPRARPASFACPRTLCRRGECGGLTILPDAALLECMPPCNLARQRSPREVKLVRRTVKRRLSLWGLVFLTDTKRKKCDS
mmetsp:Transcript_15283/g.38657  ORF Transcript_15283/g.38657 Transcript_15283/m.38657 type:complete len:224 (-) Transcript_15283:143-814(-)